MNDTDYLRFGASAGKPKRPPGTQVTLLIIVSVCVHVSKDAIMCAAWGMMFLQKDMEAPLDLERGMEPDGNKCRGPCTIIYAKRARRWRSSPSWGLLEALSSRGTVAVNSCCISPHTAWWSQQNQMDLVKSCAVFVSQILVSPQIHLIISVLSAVWVSAGMPSNTVLLSSKLI